MQKFSKFYVEKGYLCYKLESVIFACNCVFYRPKYNATEGPHGTEFWRSWNEIYQLIELKE